MTVLKTYGHSYTVGTGSEPLGSTQTIPYLLATALGYTRSNQGVSGSALITQAYGTPGPDAAAGGWSVIYGDVNPAPTAPYASSLTDVFLIHGLNDLGLIAPANVAEVFGATARACIDRIRCGGVFEDSDASVSYGSGWTLNTISGTNSGSGIHYTTTSGTTVTISVPSNFAGGTIVVGSVGVAPAAGSISFTVDGNAAGTLTMPANYAGRNIPLTKRLTGLSAGAHTIVCTYTRTAGNMYFDWWGIEAPTPPYVGWMKPIYMVAGGSGYTGYTPQGFPYNPSNAAIDTACSTLDTIAAEYGDGKVEAFDVNSVLNANASYFMSDGLHPNATGASMLAGVIAPLWGVGSPTPLTITPNANWAQPFTIDSRINVTATRQYRTTCSATVYTPTGGPVLISGTDASRFSISTDSGATWQTSVTVSAGTTSVMLSCLPQPGDASTLSASFGVPS